ncbi:endosialin [Perognathus longimembris pacificus]|uniref:endosialin n=1 Tax=Perognathus longimembris pacificus TaxID=214514 RepID=UPI0020188A35|nr:endosialin [Perognathus longimembris pacificus]
MLLRLLLAWAAAVPALGPAPRAACGPRSCYALFPRRRTFLDAWRACRELGGDLATPRTPEEARRVDGLLGGAGGAAGGLLWIGLQRPARQCQAQRPLRGFTWTTGDQDTAFTNWAQPASAGPCPAQRCVALEAGGAHRWLEGSCTLAVDGYLCQFGFEGACPALPDEAGQDGPAVYTTPFHLVSADLQWLPFGSVAAVRCGAGRGASRLCAQQPAGGVGWSPAGPLCPGPACGPENGGCEHECVEEAGRAACRCPDGFRLAADGRSCEDPCARAPCEQQCEPGGPRGFRCHCRLGFRPAEDEPHRCVDTDECQIAGVCQQMCVNYVGGFECYCREGHELEEDGISCSPAGATGARASQDLRDELLDDGEDGEDVEEAWEVFDGGWTEPPGIAWMEPTPPPHFGLPYGPGFPEDPDEPTWPPPLSAPGLPDHAVLSATRPAVVSATRPTLPSAPRTPLLSATRRPPSPALRPPTVPAARPAAPRDHQIPGVGAGSRDAHSAHQPRVIPSTLPARPPAPRPPVTSAQHPALRPPGSPDALGADTQTVLHPAHTPASPAPRGATPSAGRPPLAPGFPGLGTQPPQPPRSSPGQPSLPTASSSLATAVQHHPAASQAPRLPPPRPSQSPTNQTPALLSPRPRPTVPQVPRERGPGPRLAPWLPSVAPTAAPTAMAEADTAGRSQRDDRWLLVALLVPTCVFLVVLLALGIVYCTRCGPHAPNKSITDCYRWVTHAGSKGPTEPAPPRGSLTGVQTCRTSV